MSDDFCAIWDRATEGLTKADDRGIWLSRWGITDRLIERRAVGCLRTTVWGNSQWAPKETGDQSIILPVGDSDGTFTDLIAFRPESPRSFWTLNGSLFILGAYFVERARHFNEPLVIYESPADWIQSKLCGAVILDWRQNWAEYLQGIPSIRCFSVPFAQRLRDALMRPFPIPPIEVAQ